MNFRCERSCAVIIGLGLSLNLACYADPCDGGGTCLDSNSGTSTSSSTSTTAASSITLTATLTATTTSTAETETETGIETATGTGTDGSTTTSGTTTDTSICGDGLVEGDEICDQGEDNQEGLYGGCTPDCVLGPHCGDGLINGGEACDDANTDITDGCLGDCVEPASCLEIKELVDDAPSGIYRLWPREGIDVKVWCDMETDGGGYTLLKVHTVDGNGNDRENNAKEAEKACQVYGLHLFAPRSKAHLLASFAVATGDLLTPVGGGEGISGSDYLEILSIYPVEVGNSCTQTPFNFEQCPGWAAEFGEVYWVSDVGMFSQPSANNCKGCSMQYQWTAEGSIATFIALSFGGQGFRAPRFLCQAADKLP